MKLENQVCTLEQAEKLFNLGVEQTSSFWWKCNVEQNVVICGCTKRMNEKHFSFNNWFSAFTVAELGVIIKGSTYLPIYISSMEGKDYWHAPGKGRYETEAQARAAVLIWMIEEGVASIEEINQRLQNS